MFVSSLMLVSKSGQLWQKPALISWTVLALPKYGNHINELKVNRFEQSSIIHYFIDVDDFFKGTIIQ